MSDLIKREDAIEAIEELPNAYNGWSDAYDKAYIIGALEEVPSADRPQGEWIKDNLGTVICSECKRPRRDNRINHINFCNSCGARMKGADDETD